MRTKVLGRWLSRLGCILCGLAVLTMPAATAETPPIPESRAGSLQYSIEIGQHERLVGTRAAETAVLAPFVSDGCSGGLSVGWAFLSSTFPAVAARHGAQPPWERCCVDHDRDYHTGGSPGDADDSFVARLAADETMRACVIEIGEARAAPLGDEYGLSVDQVGMLYRAVADVMYRAVRLGGAPCTLFDWRWGFGWPKCD